MPDHQELAGIRREMAESFGFAGPGHERFLAKHMFTGFKCLTGQGKMGGGGRGNDNRMNRWICKYLPKITGDLNLWELAAHASQSLRVEVDTISDTGVRMTGKVPNVIRSPVTTANDGHSDLAGI